MNKSPLFSIVSTPIGELTLVSNGAALLAASFHGLQDAPKGVSVSQGRDAVIDRAEDELRRYFAGEKVEFSVALDPQGTDFQREVWASLRTIRYGELSTYGAVAERVGNRNGVRAVGGAIGRNPIVIIIPCHRVVGSDGALTGFSAGIDRKIYLLNRECPDAVQSPSSSRGPRVSLPHVHL